MERKGHRRWDETDGAERNEKPRRRERRDEMRGRNFFLLWEDAAQDQVREG